MRVSLMCFAFMGLLRAQTVAESVQYARELLRGKTQVSHDSATRLLEGLVATCDNTPHPGCHEAYAWYGMVLESQTRADDLTQLRKRVEPMYAKAIERSGGAPNPLYFELQGRLLKVLGEEDRSESLLRRALALRQEAVSTINTEPVGGLLVEMGRGVERPKLIERPAGAEYTPEARLLRCEGDVTLSVVVDSDGRPRSFRLQRSLGFGLDEAAVKAVERWRFLPATKDWNPVPLQVQVVVNFRLL
jgi:TonB family protein